MDPTYQSDGEGSLSQLGVSVAFFKHFIDLCGGRDQLEGLTTADVSRKFVIPLTSSQIGDIDCDATCTNLAVGGRGGSFCDFMHQRQKDDESMRLQFIGISTIFISHAWKYLFLDVVAVLTEVLGEGSHAYLWFDLFSNSQHNTFTHDFNWWCDTFKNSVSRMKHTIVVLAPWSDPVPLTRVWCLWEIFCSAETQCKVEIVMSNRERESFHEALVNNFDSIDNMIATVDARKAESFIPSDKDKIFSAIECSAGGFDCVNTTIFEQLMKWLCTDVIDVVNNFKTNSHFTAALSDGHKIKFLCNAGRLLLRCGMLEDAEITLRFGTDYCRDNLSDTNDLYLECWSRMGEVLCDRGKYDEAALFMEFVVNKKCDQGNLLGAAESCTDSSVVEAMSALAALRMKQGRLSDAHTLATNAVRGAECVFAHVVANKGASDSCIEIDDAEAGVVTAKCKLASVQLQRGIFAEASQLYSNGLAYRRQRYGNSHPSTVELMNNLAQSVTALGDYATAEQLYLESLQCKKVKYGAKHPSTLSGIGNISSLYRVMGQLNLAQPLMEEVLATKAAVLGASHPSTLVSASNLAGLLKDRKRYAESAQLYLDTYNKSAGVIGAQHPHTLTFKSNYAYVLVEMGEFALAESILQEVLAVRIVKLGENHPHTLFILHHLGRLALTTGSLDTACAYLTKALQGRLEMLGEFHKDTVDTRAELSKCTARGQIIIGIDECT